MESEKILNVIKDEILWPYWGYSNRSPENFLAAKRAFIDALIILTNSRPPKKHEDLCEDGFTMYFVHDLGRLYKSVKLEDYFCACMQLSDMLDISWTEDLNDGFKILLEDIREKNPRFFQNT